jgi:DNA processing protein
MDDWDWPEGGYDVSMPKSEAELEREARLCLAQLNDTSVDTEVCIEGIVGAWERYRMRNRKARGIRAEDVQREADEIGLRLLTPGHDAEWPAPLDDLSCHAPLVVALWVAGQPLDLRQPVCITGARACTAYGEQVAQQMAHELAAAGHTVVTSLSYGIDAAALKGALAADGPAPVVVLAHGVAHDVPPRLQAHENLVEALMRRGTVVTEFPPGTKPSRTRFELRGRIMAALAQATVVVEGVSRSGARYVARDALTLQRHMVAVPGPVTSATSALPHELIATGKASLVTCAQDVIDHLAATTITDILGVTEEDQ